MMQIAIYGKGGIGKSTISANISYQLSARGMKVLQIGCDPKHDSTRLLLNGREQCTVLDYIKETPPYDRRLEDIMLIGTNGIRCVESGGPEPGIGCAGRGILTTFETLKRLGLEKTEFDVKIYDVLGDVVCGGFAVPLRDGYADSIYLVTSGEFMSIYAANNILKGIRNYNKEKPRIAGIILNCRGMENEYETVKRFADAVGLPIIASIPRDELFSKSENEGRTVSESFPDSHVVSELRKISDHISSIIKSESKLCYAKPLNNEQMEQICRGLPVIDSQHVTYDGLKCDCRLNRQDRKKEIATEGHIIQSCASSGAVHGCSSITDAVTIVHGPRSCAHIMTSSKDLTDLRKKHLKSDFIPRSSTIRCTDMDDTVSIFGGLGLAEQKIRDMILEGQKTIFVVTTCVSGIIGDNIIDLVQRMERENPGTIIRAVIADGNIIGDWNDGFIESADALLDLVDETVEPQDGCVNILAERYFFKQGEEDEDGAVRLLEQFGLKVNCRFMYSSTTQSVIDFKKARFNFIIDQDKTSMSIAKLIERRLHVDVIPLPLPKGMFEFREFSKFVSKIPGMKDTAKRIIDTIESEYDDAIKDCIRVSKGKRIILVDKFTENVDWLIEIIQDLGMNLLVIGVGTKHIWAMETTPSRYSNSELVFKKDYDLHDLLNDIPLMKPDIIITDSGLVNLKTVRCMTYSRPDPGMDGILYYVDKIKNVILAPVEEGWKIHDW